MKILSIVILLVGLYTGVNAQNNAGGGNGRGGAQYTPAQRAQNTMDKLSAKISLTKVQKDSLTGIFTSFYTNMSAMRQQGNMEGIKSLAEARDQHVKAILNDDKLYAQYQQFIAEQKARMRQGGQGGGMNNGGNGN